MTNLERAEIIRKRLKDELGYSKRIVNVKTRAQAIDVIARSPKVDLKKVFAIASQYKTDYNYVKVGENYSSPYATHFPPTCELH